MKSLNDYTEQAQTDLFKEMGAFFAFSNKQVDEQKQADIKYVSLGYGLIAPKENAKKLMDEMENINKRAIKLRLNEYGLSKIIQYELANYESQISMDYTDALFALEDYGVTDAMMQPEFKKYMAYCRKHDLF